MKRRFRRGLGVLAVITALLGGGLSGCTADANVAADASAHLEATYAGRAADGQTFVVAVRSGISFMVYACDDVRDAWFRAESLVSPMELTDDRGNTLLLALDDEGGARGAITFGDAEAIPFTLDRTDEEVLFRAEAAMSGERLLGGWIRLPDGEQRGVVRRASTAKTSRVEIVDGLVRVAMPEGLGRLGPAAFTPRALQTPTPARPERFELYGLGDSYGAGEGAPEVPGDYEDDGTLREGGDREEWDASLTTEAERREARACHRSGISGVQVAADILSRDYGAALDLHLGALACSGSQTEHLHSCSYRGAIGDHFERSSQFLRPQISRMRAASRESGVDAVYMSIGGNDMRFGQIVAACLHESLTGEGIAGNICGRGAPIDATMLEMAGEMRDRYRLIADALDGVLPSNHVYISQYPNPLADADGDPCEEVDLLRFGGLGVIGDDEVAWLSNTVVPRLNAVVEAGAVDNGWSLVAGHLERFQGHGYCSSDPWFVDNPTSLRLQGRWMTDALNDGDFPRDTCISPAETSDDPGPVRPATIAGGIVHPNADGYEHGYGPAIAAALRAQVEDHIRPLSVGNLRIQDQQRRDGSVLVAWDDRASTETEYRVEVRFTSGTGLPRTERAQLAADSTEYEIVLSVRATGTVEVTPCFVGPAPGRREVCGAPRSLAFSNVPPTRVPDGVRVEVGGLSPFDRSEIPATSREVRVRWNASTEPGVVFYDVELENVDGSGGRFAAAGTSLLVTAQLRTARVRACNFVGCSEPSLVVNGPACPVGQVVGLDSMCVASRVRMPSTRDLLCEQIEFERDHGQRSDPAGLCSRP